MPIIVHAESPQPVLTDEIVRVVMAVQQAHCAPSTWDKFVKSLRANKFQYPTA